MYLCYMDESGTPDLPGNTSHFILVGLSVPVWHWKTCDGEIAQLKREHSLGDKEIHCAWMLRRYLEQAKIKDFAKLKHDDRRAEVEKLRNAELRRLQRTSATRYRQAKKNYGKTEPYTHLTENERRKFIAEAAKTLSQWGFARLFAECIKQISFSTPFECSSPLAGWRKVRVRERKTAVDSAQEIKDLLDTDYREAETVVLVCDNLNTHTPAALYEAFSPEEARRLARRLEIHYTPNTGAACLLQAGLNIVEIELSVLSNQCLKERIPDIESLKEQTSAWSNDRNNKSKAVHWRFTTNDARIKLRKLYPDYAAL